ncbi:MAG: hypothetical protein ACI9LM_004411 [Alteromonadaceae bacterium]|jgi:hypothetical protein
MKTLFTWFNTLFNNRRFLKRERLNSHLPWVVSLSLGPKNDVDDMFFENKPCIDKAQKYLPFNDKEFEQWVKPSIEHIANHYLYLPNDKEHYCKPGGAFENSINSAMYAAMLINTQTHDLYNKIDGEYRNQYKTTCPLAVFLFALIQYTGRALSDYKVLACDKRGVVNNSITAWNPVKETLYDWVKVNGVKYYIKQDNSDGKGDEHKIYIYKFVFKFDNIIKTFQYSELLDMQLSQMLSNDDDQLTRKLLKLVEEGNKKSQDYYLNVVAQI